MVRCGCCGFWLTQQMRVDRDLAGFGQATFDVTDQLSVTGGVRVFEARNTLYGFFGYGPGWSSHTGESQCFDFTPFQGAPCVDLNQSKEEVDATYKANISYKFDEDRMVYATASSGYRPPESGWANRSRYIAHPRTRTRPTWHTIPRPANTW